ncbi:hypothetical protein G7046_g1947 [Stylonectria norvegica]|nr:hypothetical protein G7046_g1947 [Stylonectria norvegica]
MDSLLGLDFSRNYSFFTVPAAVISTIWPHGYSVFLSGTSYDIANPRNLRESVAKNETLDKARKQRISRAKAASENGFETLGFYAAAVVAANHAGVEVRTLNNLTFGYIFCRILYNYIYIWLGQDRKYGIPRSIVWNFGFGLAMTLWIKAGLKMMKANEL